MRDIDDMTDTSRTKQCVIYWLAGSLLVLLLGIAPRAQAADLFVTSNIDTVDCQERGVGPGDTITLAAGVRNEISFRNCTGNANQHIRIINDTTGTEPTRIQTSSGGPDKVFHCENCKYVTVDGTGKWVGAPSGVCGVTAADGTWGFGRQQCGIVVECANGGGGKWYVRLDGSTTKMTLKGMEINGGYPSCDGSNLGTGISLNDHTYQNRPGEWREGFLITQNYVHHTASECMYLGPNQDASQLGDLQLRDNEISYNLVEYCGFDSIELKSTIAGESSIHHNYVAHSGINPSDTSGNVGHGISVFEGGYTSVYNNYVINTLSARGGGNCYGHFLQKLSSNRVATAPVSWYNNVAVDCKGRGINSGRNAGTPVPIPTIYNNTIVNADVGINAGVTGSSCTVRNNVVADSGNNTINQCERHENLSGSVQFFRFANPAGDDYRLTASSPAVDSVISGAPPLDHFDVVRGQGDSADIGAFEYDLGQTIAPAVPPNPPTFIDNN